MIVEVALLGTVPVRESKFMCERLELIHADGVSHVFLFERGFASLVDEMADSIKPDSVQEVETIETVPSTIGEELEEPSPQELPSESPQAS